MCLLECYFGVYFSRCSTTREINTKITPSRKEIRRRPHTKDAETTISLPKQYVTLASWYPLWRLKSPASRLLIQSFIQTQIKENIKAPRHWPLWGEFTGTGEFSAQRASYAENVSIWWRHHDTLQLYHKGHPIHEFTTTLNPVATIAKCNKNTIRLHLINTDQDCRLLPVGISSICFTSGINERVLADINAQQAYIEQKTNHEHL